MNRSLPHIFSEFTNTPLCVMPQVAETYWNVLTSDRFEASVPEDQKYEQLRMTIIGSTAVIPLHGTLVNRGAWVGSSSGMTSYEGFSRQLDAARGDDAIENIVLDIDSGGGAVGGLISLMEKIRSIRAEKPIVAVVNDLAASAAYGIASSCSEIVLSKTSNVGSIGVVMVHWDESKKLETKGVKPTIIQAGARKYDGNSFGPLSDEVRGHIQQRIDTTYDLFIEAISEGRGSLLNQAAARATEAAVFMGQQAIDAGLADRFGTMDSILAELQENKMSREKTADENVISAEDQAAAITAAHKKGFEEANARSKEILTSNAAEGRTPLAQKLAFEMTGMSSADAISLMETTPAEQPKATFEQDGFEGFGSSAPDVVGQSSAQGWKSVIDGINASSGV